MLKLPRWQVPDGIGRLFVPCVHCRHGLGCDRCNEFDSLCAVRVGYVFGRRGRSLLSVCRGRLCGHLGRDKLRLLRTGNLLPARLFDVHVLRCGDAIGGFGGRRLHDMHFWHVLGLGRYELHLLCGGNLPVKLRVLVLR